MAQQQGEFRKETDKIRRGGVEFAQKAPDLKIKVSF